MDIEITYISGKIQNGGSGGVVRPSIRDSQSPDSGPNPDRSIFVNFKIN